MAYNRDNFIRLKRIYESKNLNAKKAAEERTKELHSKFNDLNQIDSALRMTGIKLMSEALLGKDNLEKRIEKIKQENLELQKARDECLKYHGFPSDYTDVKYECPDCHDTGYIEMKMCHCFKKALVIAGFESSGLGGLLKNQSFDTFDISFYLDDKRAYDNIKQVLAKCRDYAENYTPNSTSLLLCGATGLGKTHLSTSIARVIIEKGYDVVYDSSQNIINDFEKEHFKGAQDLSPRYFECDLLIIDDLGTEMQTAFSVATVYNIINTRLNGGKSTIINTNLTHEELRKRYADRITSRLFGCFEPLLFLGKDIRMKKLR